VTADDHRPDDEPRSEGTKSDDPFLQLMFFQPSETGNAWATEVRPAPQPEHYSPLRQSKPVPGATYSLARPAPFQPVRIDSPAIQVMTDLKKAAAVTTSRRATIDEANRTMISHGVRALFVVDEERRVLGIVTATDILGEKPIYVARQREIRHQEIAVQDVMVPVGELEFIDLESVRDARVGDVIATLRLSGRQHALVVDATQSATTGQPSVCGIFSVTQIARQLGLPPQPGHEIARTFAEIEAAISR